MLNTVRNLLFILLGWVIGTAYLAGADQITIINSALNGGSYPWDECRADINNNFDDLYLHWTLITVTTPVDLDTMDALIDANVLQISEFVTLSGRPAHSTDLGTFPGSTIPDSSNNKGAFQALETAVEDKENTGVAQGLLTTHETTHPVPTTRDARNQIAGNYADGTTNTGDQVGDGVTITGAGTPGDPFVSVGGTIVADTTDPTKAAKAVEAEELVAPKVSGTPGYSFWFEAETTNELFTGFQGPADLSVNISHVMPSSAGTVGQVLEIETVQTGQTLANGETGTLVTLKNGAKGSGVGGYVATPTYSDDTCTTGQYSWDASYYYGCESTDQWDRYAVTWTNWSNPAPTIPTMTSATIPSAGTTVSLLFSEAITIGSGGNGGWTLNTPTNAMTYVSGDTTNNLVYSLASTINSTDTPTITYTQPGDGLESGTGGDLASIVAGAVVNNSTQGGGGLLAALNCYQNNGEALDTGEVNVTAANITHGTGHDSVADASVVINANADQYSFPCNETNGLIDLTQGSIEFWYKHTSDISSGHLFAQSSDQDAIRLFRNGTADSLYFNIGSGLSSMALTTDIFDGSWHKILATWDTSTNERFIYVGGVLDASSSSTLTYTARLTGDMWIGNRSGLFASDAEFQDFKIYNTVITP